MLSLNQSSFCCKKKLYVTVSHGPLNARENVFFFFICAAIIAILYASYVKQTTPYRWALDILKRIETCTYINHILWYWFATEGIP